MTILVGEQIQTVPPFFGGWVGTPTSYAFQWQDSLDGASLNGTVIGETRSDIIVSSDELGRWLRVQVTAFSAGGESDPALSAWVGPVLAEEPDVAAGSRRRNRRSQGGSQPHGRIRRTVR